MNGKIETIHLPSDRVLSLIAVPNDNNVFGNSGKVIVVASKLTGAFVAKFITPCKMSNNIDSFGYMAVSCYKLLEYYNL